MVDKVVIFTNIYVIRASTLSPCINGCVRGVIYKLYTLKVTVSKSSSPMLFMSQIVNGKRTPLTTRLGLYNITRTSTVDDVCVLQVMVHNL